MIELHVYCRRGGVTREAGLHATYADESDMEGQLRGDLSFLAKCYDEVYWSLRRDGQEFKYGAGVQALGGAR